MTHDSTPIAAPRLDTTLNRARVAPLPQLKSQQICTIGAPDAYRVDYQTLCEVPTPETTYHPRSGNAQWQPVPYASFVNGARDAMANVLNQDPVFETYALNNSGSQMFGMIGFGSGITGQAITVALRSSLDKTIAPAAAIGSAPFVCANGCFSGDFMISAKQTTNVFGTLGKMFNDICDEAVTPVLERIRMVEGWRDIPVKNDSAYQAVTAAGQRTAPRNAFRHFAGIDHATKAIADAGGSVTDAYIPSFDLQIREYVDAAEAK
jgi:hypothetical protein